MRACLLFESRFFEKEKALWSWRPVLEKFKGRATFRETFFEK
jgi:hypothetical protein